MTFDPMPPTEVDVLMLATDCDRHDVRNRLWRLSELERNVLEWRAPIAGGSIDDREVARRLGVHRRDVRRIAEIATGKLRHPAFGEPLPQASARHAA
jgi:DNA-directed RNA polymerase sigma subunit (sigma70/sigma32)